MDKTLFALSLGFAGLILAAQATQGAPQGATRAQVLAHLADTCAETRQPMRLAANNMVMEVHASSGTITVTNVQGLTCLVASGLGYAPMTEQLPARAAPV